MNRTALRIISFLAIFSLVADPALAFVDVPHSNCEIRLALPSDSFQRQAFAEFLLSATYLPHIIGFENFPSPFSSLLRMGTSSSTHPPSDKQLSKQCAGLIQEAFNDNYDYFNDITHRSKSRFERRQWKQVRWDATERIIGYRESVEATVERLRDLAPNHFRKGGFTEKAFEEDPFWHAFKKNYTQSIAKRYESDLALTYFYSVIRKAFAEENIPIEYSDDGIVDKTQSRVGNNLLTSHKFQNGAISSHLIKDVLQTCQFKIPYKNLDRNAEQAAERLNRDLTTLLPSGFVGEIEILKPLFFRNKGAYIVGRVKDTSVPIIFALENDERGVRIDAVLSNEQDISRVFSFTRSNFHVETHAYRELVDFLASIMPNKDRAAILSSIGFIQPAKIEMVRQIRRDERTAIRFEPTVGQTGTVMVTFMLPDQRYVYKMISDKFPDKENVNQGYVANKYRLVHVMDRVGRMLDATLFQNLRFHKNMFPPDLLEELKKRVPSALVIQGDCIILKQVYIQRRVEPFDYLMEKASSQEMIQKLAVELGWIIKDLAASGIWVGDVKPKNYGMTEFTGRGVSFDYDELEPLVDMNFVDRLEAHYHATEDEDYRRDSDYKDKFVDHKISIHDLLWQITKELPNTTRLPFEEAIKRAHPELFTLTFWQDMQQKIRAGELPNIYPYPAGRRLLDDTPVPSKPLPSAPEMLRETVREEIFMHNDGIDFTTTVDVLARHGIISLLRQQSGITLREILKLSGGHAGYVRVALRLLEDQGWVTHKNFWLRPNSVRYKLTVKGRIATRPPMLQAYSEMAEFIRTRLSTIREIDNFLTANPSRGPPLSHWANFAIQRFHLGIEQRGSFREEVQRQVMAHLRGVLAGPIMVSLQDKGILKMLVQSTNPLSREELQEASTVTLNYTDVESAFEFLEEMGWLQKNRRKLGWGHSVEIYALTETGRTAANLVGSYGVPVSYLPMLSQLDELLYGDPRKVFERDENGNERHLHRRLNVIGSGAAHKKYFDAVKERVHEIFNRPIEEQPEFIADMGCGDGTFLALLYDYILKNTLRGQLIQENPEKYKLWIIGADFNAVARQETEKTFKKTNIPYYRVLKGDINDPDALAETLRELHLGLNPFNGLHTNTFLIHNRPFLFPNRLWRFLGFWKQSVLSGAYVSPAPRPANGEFGILNSLLERNLFEFFQHWKPYISRFGMLAIELHLVSPDLASENIGKLIATSYHATHLYSGQYIIEVPFYLAIALKSDLSAAWHQVVPKNLPGGQGAITFTHFLASAA